MQMKLTSQHEDRRPEKSETTFSKTRKQTYTKNL